MGGLPLGPRHAGVVSPRPLCTVYLCEQLVLPLLCVCYSRQSLAHINTNSHLAESGNTQCSTCTDTLRK